MNARRCMWAPGEDALRHLSLALCDRRRMRNATHSPSETDQARCRRWVKTGKAQREQMFSALALKADIAQHRRHVRFVPQPDDPVIEGLAEASSKSLHIAIGSIERRRRSPVQRRELTTFLGGAAAALPLAAQAQQPRVPTIGYLHAASPNANLEAAFRKGLSEMGFVDRRSHETIWRQT
jgi:hypothetical protein